MRHIILNHIDSPLKILFWTRGELLIFLIPFFGGLFLDAFLTGSLLAIINSWGISKCKHRFGKGQLQAMSYAYGLKKLKTLPPSYIREFLG
jgi:type IV conjugative transfer system protein TraL